MRFTLSLIFFCLSFSLSAQLFCEDIITEGNKRTKDKFIFRETPININQSYEKSTLDSLVEVAQGNLYRSRLFNDVQVNYEATGPTFKLYITVVERWYIWPSPIVQLADPNFNIWLKSKDFSRLNFGAVLNWDNVGGMGNKLNFRFKTGYNNQFKFAYTFITKNEPGKNSGINIAAEYVQRNEVATNTINDKRVFASINAGVVEEVIRAQVAWSKRLNYFNSIYVATGWQYNEITDTVLQQNSNYLGLGNKRIISIPVQLQYQFDNRNEADYPLKGFFNQTSISLPNFTEANRFLTTFFTDLRWYQPISKKFFWQSSLIGQHTTPNANINYITQKSINTREAVRGYELYIIDAQSWFTWRNNLKFNILPTKKFTIPFIPWSQFNKARLAIYTNAFIDYGYFQNTNSFQQNNLGNQNLLGYGLGLDFVTYYGKVLRIEVVQNHIHDINVFLHFKKSI